MMLFVFSVVLSLNFSYAATPNTLVVHYYRYDDIYDHTFWMWESKPTGGTGKEFTFYPSNKDEHGVYFEVNLGVEYPTATEVGIIIKKGAGWSGEREPGGDRFINLSDIEVKNGKAHAYFVQGSVKFATSDEDL